MSGDKSKIAKQHYYKVAIVGALARIDKDIESLQRSLTCISNWMRQLEHVNKIQGDSNDPALDEKIDDLFTSVRLSTVMKENGVVTLRDLAALTEYDLAKMKNLGAKTIREIKELLAENGLRLANRVWTRE